MREFFSLDGAFNKYAGFLADTLILSLIWILFSIPIVTIGASSTALFYVSTRRIANREGYITSDFWRAFKSNFLRATAVWVVILLVLALLLMSMWVGIQLGDEMGAMSRIVLPVQILALLQIFFLMTFLFPVLARFDMGVIQAAKTCFFMANRHLLTSILCVGMLFLLFVLIIEFPQFAILIFVAPGIYAMSASYLIMRIFKKYRPEMDRDPALELQEIEQKRAEEKRRAELGLPPLEPENIEEEENENI